MRTLVVIDMQNDFIDGPLGTPEAQAIVAKVQEKIASYRAAGDRVVFTRDTHAADYLDTQEGKRLPVVHCVHGTHGWQISKALEVADSSVVDKPTFGSLALAEAVGKENEQIELVGVCTDICVISNALLLKAALPETHILVDAACCAGVTPQRHANALEAMRACQIDIAEA